MASASIASRRATPPVGVPQVLHDGVPEGLAESIHGEERGDECTSLHALNPFGTPVDIRQAQPQRELVERQAQRDPEDDGDPKVPRLGARGERDEPGEHQQEDSPKKMMDMKSARGDEIAERSVREELVVNDRRDHPQHGERHEECREDAQGDAAAQTETLVMLADARQSAYHLTAEPVATDVEGLLSAD
jgi:hypothetical protein